MAAYDFNTEQKPASEYTRKRHFEVARKLSIDLLHAKNDECEYASRHCILPLEEGYSIKAPDGHTVWSLEGFKFLKQEAVSDTVNPSLWLNGRSSLAAGVFEVVKGKIFQVRGVDIANITFVRSRTGWIVLDVTTCVESAAAGVSLLEKALGEDVKNNIRAVIISHSHMDHFGGIRGVVKKEDVGPLGSGKIPVIVPGGFDTETVKENVYAGPAMLRRSGYQFGLGIAPGEKGKVSAGLGIDMSNGTVSYIAPTDFITEDTTLTIDGLTVVFQLTPETEAPAEMNNFFPEYRAFWAAENCTATLHNLYPIRGAKLRDSAGWWKYIMEALVRFGDDTDVVFQSHHWPHENTEDDPGMVKRYLLDTAATYKYLHDRTLYHANRGKTEKETAHLVKMPENLEKAWYTRPYYGSREINIRAVFNRYLGFYNADPVTLDPLTEREEAELFLEYAGSSEKVLEKALKSFEDGEYNKTARALGYLVTAEPENREAKLLLADTLEQLAYQAESSIWRNAYLVRAKELRTPERPQEHKKAGVEIVKNMPLSMKLDYLGTVLDSDSFSDADEEFDLTITGDNGETKENFRIFLYNGTLMYVRAKEGGARQYVRLSEKALLAVLSGRTEEIGCFANSNCYSVLKDLAAAVRSPFEA
ncbi:MAG: MBL fold metallo-hydrolase [Lachnospiraceae bacterium]|nr:MBL fold metallo-hydrolase [Lachnospiraceae bacterium]